MRGIIDSEVMKELTILLEKDPEHYKLVLKNLEAVLTDLSDIQIRINKRHGDIE